MDSHQKRDLIAKFKSRIEFSEDKMRLLAQSLEDRNQQLTELLQRYNELEEQYRIAKDDNERAAKLLDQRDEKIEQLEQLLNELNNRRIKQSKKKTKAAEDMQDELKNERIRFIETLNTLSKAKAPAEEAFQKNQEFIQKKIEKCKKLKENLRQMTEDYENCKNRNEDLQKENDDLREQNFSLQQSNENLKIQLEKVINGCEARKLAEKLKLDLLNMKNELRNRDTTIKNLAKDIQSKDNEIANLQQQLAAAEVPENEKKRFELIEMQLLREKQDNQELKKENRTLQTKNDKLQKSNETYEQLVKHLRERKEEIKQEKLKCEDDYRNLLQQRSERATNNIKKIKDSQHYQTKIDSLKQRCKAEIEEKLSAKENLLKYKEENFQLKKELAILRDQLSDAKAADIEPLVQLLKDLRLELIEIDAEYIDFIKAIPLSRPIDLINIPKGICESEAAIIAHIGAQASDIFEENKELRLILERIARYASTFHRIATVISKYPILSTDDIGLDEPYGNWVLPVEVEHLQRTIIKLHEILSRRQAQ